MSCNINIQVSEKHEITNEKTMSFLPEGYEKMESEVLNELLKKEIWERDYYHKYYIKHSIIVDLLNEKINKL